MQLAELEAERQAAEEAAAAAAAAAAAQQQQQHQQQPGSPVHGLLAPGARHGAAAAGAGATTPLLLQAAAGLRAPANTPATAARTPVPRFDAGSAVTARRAAARTGAAAAGGGALATPLSALKRALAGGGRRSLTPGGAITPRGGAAQRSPSAVLLPIRLLFGLDVAEAPPGRKGVAYTHRATGFSFLLGPADKAESEGQQQQEAGEDEEGEEEVAFEPLAFGTAEACLPDFLRERITFAASRREQLVKIVFDALAAARHAGGAGGAAA